MMKQYGKIIKLNRIQLGLKQENITYRTGISESQLSRVERNRADISFENAKQIFQAMGIEISDESINDSFEQDFLTFYEDVAYIRDYKQSYKKIMSYQSVIQPSLSYVKYLLAELIYIFMTGTIDQVDKYLYLEDYFEYLESYQIQLFYDYIGGYYYKKHNYDKALFYYQEAARYKGTTVSKSMLDYHLSMLFKNIGKLNQSLEYAKEAESLFSYTINLKRLVCNNSQLANIYASMRDYKKSEIINLRCIQAFQDLSMNSDISYIYNNLLWLYIRSNEYEKVINLKEVALETTKQDHSIYFYLSFAYYKLGYEKEAKENIKLAKEHLNSPSFYMKTMIQAFAVYLSHSQFKRKEKHLLKAHEAALKSYHLELEIFTLNLLKEFYHENEYYIQEMEYSNKLIECYKRKK